ncbi:hypothetical protein NP493_5582g00002 [Ridgeia piscesae]|uniref:Reverse transcriptase domain-containing protein n=1 Tax=Ridgeia piscesae TaxID=27915 RepID=A0AAD9ITR0_RIDPI|nr:hypothetical protein NP493_5582g00002 [Ridgeia piscesae]
MVDFIITRCRDKMDIHSTRAMRGTNCWTDHEMLRSKVAFRIQQKHNRQGTRKPTKLNTAKLSTISHRQNFEQDSALGPMGGEGKINTRRGMSTRSTTAAYKDARRLLQNHARTPKSDWWEKKAVELQRAADRNDIKGFYGGLKELRGPTKKGPVHLKSTDGMETFSDSKRLQEKCIEQDRPLYMVFVDCNKAFDTVRRTGLLQLVRKYGCPQKFTTMMEALHTGMMANISVGGEVSESFSVTNGVRQSCVAPTLFSVFLSAMLDEAFRDMVYIQPRQSADYSTSHTSERRPRLLGYC